MDATRARGVWSGHCGPTRYRVHLVLAALASLCILLVTESRAARFGRVGPLNGNASEHFGDDRDPRLATDGAGTWVGVWSSEDDLGGSIDEGRYNILWSRSDDAGATWTQPLPVASGQVVYPAFDTAPEIDTDGAGTWVVVWSSARIEDGAFTEADVVFSRSVDNGQTWSEAARLNAPHDRRSHYRWPKIAADGDGNWLTLWLGPSFDIRVARSTDNGATWDDVQQLGHFGRWPTLATDRAGTWILAWTSTRSELGDEDKDIVYSRSTDVGVTWAPVRALNTHADRDYEDDWRPHLAADGSGTWLAVWASEHTLSGRIGWDTDILVSRSSDDGETWTDPEPVDRGAATDDREDYDAMPRAATDGRGNWGVVWESTHYDHGHTDAHFAQSSDGGVTWSGPVALNPSTTGEWNGGPLLYGDGAKGWLAVWSSEDSLGGSIGWDEDILFSRSPLECSARPIVACSRFDKGSLFVDETVAGREKLIAKFLKGRSLESLDFGNPTFHSGTTYGVCLYDENDEIVASLLVDRAGDSCERDRSCWRSTGRGYAYRDRTGASDGVSKLVVRGTKGRKSRATVVASNDHRYDRASLPVGVFAALAGATNVTVQLETSDAGCLSMRLEDVLTRADGSLRAKSLPGR